MTASRSRDPLLLAARIMTLFLQAAMAFGALVLVGASIALPFYSDEIAVQIATDGQTLPTDLPVAAVAGVIALSFAILAAMFVFFGKLRQIVATVGEGDPFLPANADRLSLMAWLLLGVQLCLIPVTALAHYLTQLAEDIGDVSIAAQGDIDLTGLLFVIVLFILARVFRHGTQMREDLEGTV